DPSTRRVRVRRIHQRSPAALLRRFRDQLGAAHRGCFASPRSAVPAWWYQWFRKRKSASPESTRGYVGVQVLSVRSVASIGFSAQRHQQVETNNDAKSRTGVEY